VAGAVAVVAIAILILVNIVTSRRSAVTDGRQPCQGAPIRPGDDVQHALDAEPGNTTVCLAAGVYRLAAPLRPADGQRLMAAPGAILTGAVGLDGWQREGRLWHVRGHLPAEPILHGECVTGTLCQHTGTVYLDDRPLERVGSRELVAAGRFWADYDADKIWIGDDPTGHVLEIARTPAAIVSHAKDVVVRGFVIEKFANPAQRGAIHADGDGWRIEGNEVRANHGTGVYASGGQVLNNHIHDNGQLGLAGTGHGRLVEGNEIDHNNTAGFSPLWEAGGTKFARTSDLVIRGNNVHDNAGPGLWTDINNIRTTIERNIVHANTGHGIFHEISYRAVIRDNRVTDNGGADPLPGWGGAGIRVAASPDVEIYRNFLAGNQNAIMLVQQRRDDWPSIHGPHLLDNIDVHDNQVTLASHGLTGQVDDTDSDASYERSIRFRDNSYRLPSSDAKVFAWHGAAWDPATWKQRFNQDASSSFTTE